MKLMQAKARSAVLWWLKKAPLKKWRNTDTGTLSVGKQVSGRTAAVFIHYLCPQKRYQPAMNCRNELNLHRIKLPRGAHTTAVAVSAVVDGGGDVLRSELLHH